jgi:hypothetical protein
MNVMHDPRQIVLMRLKESCKKSEVVKAVVYW